MAYLHEKNTGAILQTGSMIDFEMDPVVHKENGMVYFNHQPIQTARSNQAVLCLVVDIGTTTVIVSLIDCVSHEEIASKSDLNPQRQYGQEVLSRITHVQQYGDEGLKELQRMIVKTIESLGKELCTENGYHPEDIFAIFTASNTVMDHLLMGESPIGLGVAPYEMAFKNRQARYFKEVGIETLGRGVIVSLPNVSAFVGGDIVAGMISTGIYAHNGCELFIDIGTNGELILEKEGKLYSTSCAAGPALEGMNISCGINAQDGAIEEAKMEDSTLRLQTISEQPAIGICGSGILAIVREFLQAGLILKSGNIIKADAVPDKLAHFLVADKKALWVDKDLGIYITQKDIRQIQLAKGAIISGIHFLLRESGVTAEEIDRVYIAGQFGSYLSADSLTVVGLLPEVLHERIEYVGNTSKSGCYMVAMSKGLYNELDHIVSNVHHIELSVLTDFDRVFARNARFTVKGD